ncbi:DNA methylase N-4 [Bradyrhizobium diazoefficiens]
MGGLIWYLGALYLGLRELPVIRITHLTPEKFEVYRIAEQRLSELAPWDDRAVAEAFTELSQLDLGFSLEVTGFSQGEIDFRIENLDSLQVEPAPDPADNVPAVHSTKVSAVNDLWQLGHHRILCGSALQAASFSALMAGQRARAVITDPPFNVPIQGHVSGKGRIRHREFVMASGEMSGEEFTAFLNGYLRRAMEHLTQGALLYIFMDWRHSAEILAAATAVGLELKNICAWVKSNAGMGSFYRSQHEFVFVFKYGRGSHRNNVELGRHGRFRTNVWQYPGCNSFERNGEEGNLLALHPTVKPVQLLADAILDCTERNDIVLDNFLGSGSTLLAAERVGRRLYATELEPLYVDVAIRRWQRHTGLKAVHVQTGRHFDEIAADRKPAE